MSNKSRIALGELRPLQLRTGNPLEFHDFQIRISEIVYHFLRTFAGVNAFENRPAHRVELDRRCRPRLHHKHAAITLPRVPRSARDPELSPAKSVKFPGLY